MHAREHALVLLLRQLPRAQPPCTCAQTPCRTVLATTSLYLHDDIWDKYSQGNLMRMECAQFP